MATQQLTGAPERADHPTSKLDVLDAIAHDLASYRRTTPPAPKPKRTILERFPAGAPRGQWPAESYAATQRRDGIPARVVMDIDTDSFLVVVESAP